MAPALKTMCRQLRRSFYFSRFLAYLLISLVASPVRIYSAEKKATPAAVETASATPEVANKSDSPGIGFRFAGMVAIASSTNAHGLTFGGPRFGFISGSWGFHLGFYPSLILTEAFVSSPTPLRPSLGFGPEISYGRIVLFAPTYLLSANSYELMLGLGFRF